MSAPGFTPREMMAVAAARELTDGQVVFVGIGLPNLACNLARRLQAPGLVLVYESGAIGAVPERLPVSIGDPALVTNSLGVASMVEVFYYYPRAATSTSGSSRVPRSTAGGTSTRR
jgi:glutaconate CoA-transferase subunit B